MTGAPRVYRLGEFVVDGTDRLLLRDGGEVFLRPKAFDTLWCLVESQGHLVTKDALLERVWPGTSVSDAVLTHCITEVRQALHDDPRRPRYLKTVSRRGYKLVAPVEIVAPTGTESTGEAPAAAGQRARSPAIAVLPFANLSGDPANDYLCDGIAEELINGLTKVAPLPVVAHSSSFAFKGRNIDAREIGRQLDVSVILEGSLRRADGRLRVAAQLIDAGSGYHLWCDQYDRPYADVFAIQDDIAGSILEALRVELPDGRPRPLVKPATASATAYELYLQGRSYWHRRYSGFMQRAVECFERAIAADARFAMAHTGLADCFGSLGVWGFAPPDVMFPRARALADEALRLDPGLGEAHASRAFVSLFYEWDWAAAGRGLERAIERNPGCALIRLWYAHYLSIVGRMEEAVREATRAQRLDPLSPVVNANVGWTWLLAGDRPRALAELERAVSLDPLNAMAYFYLGATHGTAGRFDDAVSMHEKAREIAPAFPGVREAIACARARMGDGGPALAILEEVESGRRQGYVMPSWVSRMHMCLGHHDAALQWLEGAVAERDPMMPWIAFMPGLDELRPHSRFARVLSALALPCPWRAG
jgi:TolB-like protein/Tfp pilus assembly protein PilF